MIISALLPRISLSKLYLNTLSSAYGTDMTDTANGAVCYGGTNVSFFTVGQQRRLKYERYQFVYPSLRRGP